MPTYDYRCESNSRVVEVMHRMNEQMRTWGELCEKAGVAPGDTPVIDLADPKREGVIAPLMRIAAVKLKAQRRSPRSEGLRN